MKQWHAIEGEEALRFLETDRRGLGNSNVEERRRTYGPNKLPEQAGRSRLQLFLAQFHNMLIYVLLAAAVVTALLGHWIDTWVILAVVVVNALIGFIQEGKAEKAMKGIQEMLSLKANVLREGERREVKAEELVPGDIVFLESGDKVPADLRLLDVKNLKVEESVLTGESVAVSKSTETAPADSVPGDQPGMAFSGTLVTYGRATGVVTGIGEKTEIGKISTMLEEVEKLTTPLLRKIEEFGKGLSVFIVVFAVLMFLFGLYIRDYTMDEMFIAVISLVVAAIPEGLPAIITITLAIGVQRMAGKNAIIRRLPAVETLGSVTVICSDKTGTLTRNEMTARTVLTAGKEYRVSGVGYEPVGEFTLDNRDVEPENETDLEQAVACGVICSEADVYEDENGKWALNGDPTEGALVSMAMKMGISRSQFPDRIDHIPFESEHKYMATLNLHEGEAVAYVKGAPEVLFSQCSSQLQDGEEKPFDADVWARRVEEVGETGERVLALAIRKMGSASSIGMDDMHDLTLIGVVGMIDPPREEAIESVSVCYQAGIRVVMITGDHAGTASAIADQLGMKGIGKVITGSDLENMDDDELKEVVRSHSVFARTSPYHKLRLVMALQENGDVVAMTGDGVNDAPALRRADIGVAMGIKGTEVSKGAAEMVLADDNFASIASAIEEGRTVYDNIRKAILFILPTNGAEAFVIMTAVLMGAVLPITPVQILWVNMVTAVTLALALAFELTEQGIMKRKPRRPSAPILSGYFIMRIGYVSVLIGGMALGVYFWMKGNGVDLDLARTVAVNILVAGQAFYLFNCRYTMHSVISKAGVLGNRTVLLAVFVLIQLQSVFVYSPWFHLWFGTTPLDAGEWAVVFGAGLIIFLMVELEKWITRSIDRPSDAMS